MDLFTGLLSSLGLSGAAGLNAYIPLLVVGLLTRAGVMNLAQPFDLLANPWVLLAVAVVGALDFVGDKIPGVDHVLHLVGGVVNTAAGAVLFASQAGVADVPPALKLALGLVVAGGVHATRAAVRPVATATTGGLGNPVVSAAEDASSLGLSVLAVFAPILAVLGLAGLGVVAYRLWSRVRGWRRRAL
ncbi:DUF4126 domain-containing protein [Deinococcus sp. Leaf326]|uniref:DUF4126 domain-containing protein n=1 Tax=Deinococcus sp. Leaf326 TaxID=1736338 RepID=UPI000700439B|nr:DUF4126 domain-containing protein [Deinococcus sp. Leaf326]KQR04707.1 hypothetical protein ASF71_11865 [Deinococcus sp. Leaf326]